MVYRQISILISLVLISWNLYSQKTDPHMYCSHSSKASIEERSSKASDNYDVKFYFLDLEMDNSSNYLEGTARIDFKITDINAQSIDFDLDDNMSISETRLDGSVVSSIHANDQISVPVSNVDTNNVYSIEFDYDGNPAYGMYNTFQVTFSLSEPYDAMGWFPVKQDLLDKADSSWVFVTVPDDIMAGSNGLLVNTNIPEAGKLTYEWKSSYPIAYYLISVSIGDYQDYSFYAHPAGSDSVLIQNFIYDDANYLNQNESKILETADILEEFSDKLGIYPHHEEKYGHCLAGFNGGMEHQTMTTLGNFDFNLVAHELGHSWFGNFITCANWQDIWINEGFAVYTEYLAHQALRPKSEADLWVSLTEYNAKLSDDGSVYVPFSELDDVSRIFSTILTYKKGGMLVHMIRYMINDDAVFFDALQEYLSVYGDSVATGDDFKNLMEAETGISFDDFFDQWYYGEGYPIYNVTWYQSGNQVNITNSQTGSCPQAPVFTIPLEYKLYFNNGDSSLLRLNNDQLVTSHTFTESRLIDSIVFDPENWIMCDFAIGQVSRLDENKLTVQISPNPSDGFFRLAFAKKSEYKIIVSDSKGVIIQDKEIVSDSYDLNLKDQADGVYLLRIISAKGRFTSEKLLLKK